MKTTDFSKYISDFISRYLSEEQGKSLNTVTAYRYTFVLLLEYLRDEKHEKIEKITLKKISKETILEFLNYIQTKRNCSDSTRNTRLAAIHSFYKYLQIENLEYLNECQKILSINFKKSKTESINYLTIDGMTLLLQQPDRTQKKGRRDLALISLMYDTGARVQEMIDLTPSSLRLSKPPIIRILGKGNKERLVPMLDAQIDHIKNYLKENKLDMPHQNMHPLFFNNRKEKLTRAGINYILKNYVKMAHKINPSIIPENISCHSLRHSKAMHLLESGINIVYIRDILGHTSVTTTEIYARADSKHKRAALEKVYVNINPSEEAAWVENKDLIHWLKGF